MTAGLSHHRLYGQRHSGELEQIGRGLNRKAGRGVGRLDLLEVAKRAPRATICLLSALAPRSPMPSLVATTSPPLGARGTFAAVLS